MQKDFLLKIVVIVTLFLFISSNPFLISAEQSEKIEKPVETPSFFSFNSYVDFSYDNTMLSDSINLGQSIAIPITIEYWTDMPDDFLKILPIELRNQLLFNQRIKPMQTIDLSVLEEPVGVEVSFSNAEISLPIPSSGKSQVETILFIIPGKNAPAKTCTIDIMATTSKIGSLNGFSYQESICFTPRFTPLIDIYLDSQIIYVYQLFQKNVDITVTNRGNGEARITPRLVSHESEWNPTINPPQSEINPNDGCTFSLTIVPPSDFSGYKIFELEFTVEVFPYRNDAPTITYPLTLMFYHQ